MDEAPNIRRALLVCLFLLMSTGLVYWQVLHHEFVNFDDLYYVTDNHHVQAGLTFEGFIWAFTTTDASNWHPLTWLSHMLDCELYGLDPSGHHLNNVVFHLANILLLFLVLKRMTGAFWRSALVAALFALHPLHVESVAWVAERKDVLSTFFWLLTMWAYVHYVHHPGFKRYLLVIVAFALGLAAKPMLVTLPFVLLLLDYWPLGRYQFGRSGVGNHAALQASIDPERSRPGALGLVLEKSPLLALTAISSVVTYLVQQSGQAVRSMETYPLTVRIANALVSYVTYIGKTIWPQNLAAFYPHPGDTLPVWQAAGAGLLLVFISIGTIRAVKRYPYLAVGWLWYLGTLVPVIGLVQVGEQAMADRYTYVPLVGLFIIAAWSLYDLGSKWQHRRIVFAIGTGAMLLALTICTWKQLQHWNNSVSLWEHALNVTQRNALAHNNLGGAFEEQGEVEKAIAHFSEAVRHDPNHLIARNNLGMALFRQGKLSEAGVHFSQALKTRSDSEPIHNNMGALLIQQGKLDEAVSHLTKALMINPDSAAAHNNMGDALARMGKLDEAIGYFYQALRIESDYHDAHNNLGTLFFGQGKFDDAIYHYRRALEAAPDLVQAHNNVGVALAYTGRFAEAISHFQKALHLKPDYREAQTNLRNVLQQVRKSNKPSDSTANPQGKVPHSRLYQ